MSPRFGRRFRRGRWPRSGVPGEEPGPIPVGDALAAVGGELGLADPRALAILTARWPEVVGDAVAAHARLRTLRRGVLTIAVDGGPWATQLRYLAGDLRERVIALVGPDVVFDVRIVVEPGR